MKKAAIVIVLLGMLCAGCAGRDLKDDHDDRMRREEELRHRFDFLFHPRKVIFPRCPPGTILEGEHCRIKIFMRPENNRVFQLNTANVNQIGKFNRASVNQENINVNRGMGMNNRVTQINSANIRQVGSNNFASVDQKNVNIGR